MMNNLGIWIPKSLCSYVALLILILGCTESPRELQNKLPSPVSPHIGGSTSPSDVKGISSKPLYCIMLVSTEMWTFTQSGTALPPVLC